MVRFVDVQNMVRWVRDTGPERVMVAMADRLRDDFRRWPEFDKTPRVPSHSAGGVIELMPTSDGEVYGFKYVNGHPGNPLQHLQTVTAFGVLADVATGYPTFLAEMTLLTALRTAATSAMVAAELARPGSTTMALVGAGSQSEFQALAFRALTGIDRVRVFDIDPAASRKFAANMRPHGIDVVVAGSAAEAADGADVVTTCTADKADARVLRAADVRPGVHVNAIGGDCPGKTELDPAILMKADVFVEYEPQTRVEGEIQQVPADFPVTEFWEVLAGRRPGRRSAEAITVFDSVGFAIEDFSALRTAQAGIAGTPYWTELDLVAEPEDPKDLFGFLSPAGVPA